MPMVQRPWRVAVGLAVLGGAVLPAGAAATNVGAVPLATPSVRSLAPGVTYQRQVLAGGEVVHVVRVAPRGLTVLGPIVVSGTIRARGDLARATRAAAPAGVVAGVNGDYFNFQQAYPSGLTITAAAGLVSTPDPLRSSLLIAPTGALSILRAVMTGTWVPIAANGTEIASPGSIAGINRPATHPSEVLLFTPGYGATIPPLPAHLPAGTAGSTPTSEDCATIAPDRTGRLAPNSVILGTVIANSTRRSVGIHPSDLVLAGVGPAAGSIATRLPVGARVSVSLHIAGIAAGALALGGGPALVVGGRPVHTAGEGFTATQLGARSERTAIGQTAGGTDLLVAAEGPGEGSPGISVSEQADLMARLGARVAMAMDSGGSSQMIVGGSEVMPMPRERAISTAMVVRYTGVRITAPATPISPNHDGVDDHLDVPVVVPSPGTLRVTISTPHRAPIALMERAVPAVPISVHIDPVQLGLPDGTYQLNAVLTSLLGSVSSDHQLVIVDRTLADLHTRPFLRNGQPDQQLGFRLTRSAVVTIRVTTRAGRTLGVLVAARRFAAGHHTVIWNQRIRRAVVTGGADIVVEATTRFGTHGLIARVVLARPRRAAH